MHKTTHLFALQMLRALLAQQAPFAGLTRKQTHTPCVFPFLCAPSAGLEQHKLDPSPQSPFDQLVIDAMLHRTRCTCMRNVFSGSPSAPVTKTVVVEKERIVEKERVVERAVPASNTSTALTR